MKNFQEYLKTMNSQTLNSLRVVIVLSITLVFGAVLYHKTFSTPLTGQMAAVANSQAGAYIANGNEPVITTEEQSAGDSVLGYDENVQEGDSEQEIKQTNVVAPGNKSADVDYGAQNLSAKAAIVIDGDTGQIIYQKNADEKLPMASLTKLMTAVISSENLNSEEKITISKEAVAQDGTAGGLNAGEEFAAGDLMKIMLIVSSNDAAAAFREYFAEVNLDLVGMMNKKAEELDMRDTRFVNSDGLDDEDHYSTARDLAKLAAYVLKRNGSVLSVVAQKQAVVRSLNKNISHNILSTNQLLLKNNPDILGGKTGYTKNAEGCMASILKDGRVIIVLGSEDRFGETEKLIQNTKVKSP